MSGHKVSVLLTSYNSPSYLTQAIESVLKQTYDNYELVILDDNSSIHVAAVLGKFWSNDKVKIYKSNVSKQDRMSTTRYATMINIGFSLSDGDYITYLTDDDIYLPHRLETMVEYFSKWDGVDVVYGGQACTHDSKTIAFVRPHDQILSNGYDIVDHCSVMHKRDVFWKCLGWDDDPAHWRAADGIFWNRLASQGYKMYPVGVVTDIHRFHPESVRHKLLNQGLTDLN